MPRKRWWHVELPRELKDPVEVAAAIAHVPRREWIARAIEHALAARGTTSVTGRRGEAPDQRGETR